MCLTITSKGVSKPLIAKRRIECWKVVEIEGNGVFTPYMGQGISKKEIIAEGPEQIIDNRYLNEWSVEGGFIHTFADKKSAEDERMKLVGYHIMFSKLKVVKVVKAYIPRGIAYYEGIFACAKGYASKKIILEESIRDIINNK